MQITITGGTGSLSQYIQKELAGKHDVVLFDRVEPGKNRVNYEITAPVFVGDLTSFDAYFINAADTLELEDTRDLVARLRPDLLPKLRDISGRQAFISTARAQKAFGWKAVRSWTEFLPVAATR